MCIHLLQSVWQLSTLLNIIYIIVAFEILSLLLAVNQKILLILEHASFELLLVDHQHFWSPLIYNVTFIHHDFFFSDLLLLFVAPVEICPAPFFVQWSTSVIWYNISLNHVHYSMQFPVYFAFHDDNMDNLLADIRKIASSGQPASASTGG
jgi:hypothetical protein